jgi:hypothetical protein
MAGVKGRSGRKPKWTDEQIEEAAQDLLDWLEEDSENHVWFKDWAVENSLPPEYLSRWSAKSAVFRQAMEMAEMAQESRLVNGGLRNRLNARIVALVLQSKHRWENRQSLTVSPGEPDPRKTLADVMVEQMPEDRGEARKWLQSIASGQGAGAEADEVRAAATETIEWLDILDRAAAAGAEIASE